MALAKNTALEGAWIISKLEIEGEAMPAAGRISIAGNQFTTGAMGAEYSGTVSITPQNLDLLFTTGPEKGNTCLGIYKLQGDTLQLCLTLTAKERPLKFKTTPGSGLALETLQREGAGEMPVDVTLPAKLVPVPELEGEWQMVSAVMDGKPLPAGYLTSGRRNSPNNEFKVVVMGNTMLHAHYAARKSEIDYYVHGPKNALRLQYGIWKLEGGLLTTAIAGAGKDRPADFAAGRGVTLTSWRRL